MATRGYYEEYTLEELKDLVPGNREAFEQGAITKTIEEKVTGDDRFLSKTWTEAYKFAAYYFDNPKIEDRFFFQNKFRLDFANLLQKTATSNELPDMRSKHDFVGWVCKKHNEFLEKAEVDFKVDCNVEKLVLAYGPNFDNVKGFLGEYQFYF